MNEPVTSYTNPLSASVEQQSILEDPYHKEVQLDIWLHERKKTMFAIFAVAALLLISNIIGFSSINSLDMDHFLDVALFPLIFLGLGLFALLQPMVAAILSIAVIVGISVLNYLLLGPASLISGWLFKAIALYFILSSVRHAKEAEKARKELRLLN